MALLLGALGAQDDDGARYVACYMMRPIIILRPPPGGGQTAQRAKALGLQPIMMPLFTIKARNWAMPSGADSLLLGSANAVRHAGDKLDKLQELPAYTVGRATAMAAQDAGLNVRFNGSSDLQEALDRLIDDGWRRPLRLCGLQHNALHQPDDMQMVMAINYESAAQPVPDAHHDILRKPAIILVHSARALAQLEKVIISGSHDIIHLAKQHIIIAISARAAAKASLSWGKIAVAPMPSDHEMLKLAEILCDKKDK